MYKLFFKRIFDFVISLIMVVVLLPVLLVIVFLIKIVDKGEIIFCQSRTGKDGRVFTIYKFKTMNGNYISSFGSFLRRFGIDELPQLFNIIKGDMSLIGPRPWITDYYDFFTEKQKERVLVKPGLIGLAQLKGNDIDVFEKIELDLKYIDNLSFLLDLKILFQTLIVVFGREHTEIRGDEIREELKSLSMQKK